MSKMILLLIGIISYSGLTLGAEQKWGNDIFAEKGKYTYSSNVYQSNNRLEYRCSVIKFNYSEFTTLNNLNVDLDLQLENEKIAFQNEYNVSFIFSNGEIISFKPKLLPGFNGLDRFSLALNPNKTKDNNLIKNLSNRSFVNIEIEDNKRKRIAYRFYLKGSKEAIMRTDSLCSTLYQTFK